MPYVTIPTIGIHAKVVPVTETKGLLNLTDSRDEVFWYSSSKPLTQVFAGHNIINLSKGVFYPLKNVKVGARITIGDVNVYVKSVEIVPAKSLVISLYTSKRRYMFITCDGLFFQSRVVVTAY